MAVWHENYTPNLDSFNLEESKKAGYVLDRLMRFSCVSNDRKRELMLLVKQMKDLTAKVTSFGNTFLSEDPLAAKWNLSEDIAQAMQGLLPYQTRHYTHN